MMRLTIALPSAALALAMLGGCAGTSLFNRQRPDELAVTRQPPLVIPPDFSLQPPAPGAASSQQQSGLQEQAVEAMFGGKAPRSKGETSLLERAGESMATQGIRSLAGASNMAVVDKGTTVQDIIAAPEGDGQNARAVAGQ